jgi:hypothetical protein
MTNNKTQNVKNQMASKKRTKNKNLKKINPHRIIYSPQNIHLNLILSLKIFLF